MIREREREREKEREREGERERGRERAYPVGRVTVVVTKVFVFADRVPLPQLDLNSGLKSGTNWKFYLLKIKRQKFNV